MRASRHLLIVSAAATLTAACERSGKAKLPSTTAPALYAPATTTSTAVVASVAASATVSTSWRACDAGRAMQVMAVGAGGGAHSSCSVGGWHRAGSSAPTSFRTEGGHRCVIEL